MNASCLIFSNCSDVGYFLIGGSLNPASMLYCVCHDPVRWVNFGDISLSLYIYQKALRTTHPAESLDEHSLRITPHI